MPAVPAGVPGIAPGIATGNKFPQYGVKAGTVGSKTGWSIVTAANNAQKMTAMSNGVLVWFQTRSAAESYMQEQESSYSSGQLPNPLTGLAAIGDFFHRLTEANTWIRVGEVLAGVLVLYIGLKATVTPGGVNVAHQSAKKTLTRVAEKVTPQGRAVAAARKATHHKPRPVINPRTGKSTVDAPKASNGGLT